MIHQTAIVDSKAEIDPSVEIGAYSIIGPHVKIQADCIIGPHAIITGRTTLEPKVRIFQFATVGEVPQDLKFRGEPGRVEIGAGTMIRESATVHIGTDDGGLLTRVGKGCLMMGSTHVAHDCLLGDNIIMANNTALAGHVEVADNVIMSGNVGVHQFCRIGKHAFLSGGSLVTQDVVPYCVTQGDRARLIGVNSEGLRRHQFGEDRIRIIKKVFKHMFREGRGLEESLQFMATEYPDSEDVAGIIEFAKGTTRGLARARSGS